MNAISDIQVYKDLERAEHITPDDILNKVTQEILELIEAESLGDMSDISAEAGDVLINILSFAQELGIDINPEDIQRGDNGEILGLFRSWNEGVQALRGRYTRKYANTQEVEALTKTFLGHILNYTHPDSQLTHIISHSTHKLMDRKNAYKPTIEVRDYIANYPDFPKVGIQFKDISPILAAPEVFLFVCHEMAESCRGADKILALDARGFIFAPTIAQILGIPWIMARKPGKLPGETESISYDLEYGSNTIEVQKGAIEQGESIAIVDDLLATGGTALAAISLVEKLGGVVKSCNFVIALDEPFLLSFETRKELAKYPCKSVVSYE